MINSKTLFSDFIKQITLTEEKGEIESIAYLVFDHFFGLSRGDVLMGKEIDSVHGNETIVQQLISRINNNEPIQYIIGEADFLGRSFYVNTSVLIPRPETEELVHEVIRRAKRKLEKTRLLDIGTGSGCIPITLSLALPGSEVLATDISEAALAVARRNAVKLNADIKFLQHDILKTELSFGKLDYIMSNPPYITRQEEKRMSKNVLDYEPHLALFAEGDDPLVFYRVICRKAVKALNEGGSLLMEINSSLGLETMVIFESAGFKKVNIVKDISGNDRIVTGAVV